MARKAITYIDKTTPKLRSLVDTNQSSSSSSTNSTSAPFSKFINIIVTTHGFLFIKGEVDLVLYITLHQCQIIARMNILHIKHHVRCRASFTNGTIRANHGFLQAIPFFQLIYVLHLIHKDRQIVYTHTVSLLPSNQSSRKNARSLSIAL